MATKATYEESEQRVRELEQGVVKAELDLMETLPVGISISSPEGNVADINAAGLKLFGYETKEAFLKMPAWAHYYDEKDRERFIESHKRGLAKDFEARFVRKDGSLLWCSITSVCRTTATGATQYLNVFKDISERKQAIERVEHLNRVLRAVRNVNQLISRERDMARLVQGACDTLIEARSYHNVWIALFDESRKLVTTAEAGLGKDFLVMVERMKQGDLTACGRRALSEPGVVTTKDPPSTCTDCPLSASYGGAGAMTVRLEHGGRVDGLLHASMPSHLVDDEEEQAMFREIAGDIAFALHGIEQEERRKQAEQALQKRTYDLKERVKELSCLHNISALLVERSASLDNTLERLVDLIPSGWKYPEIICARILLNGKAYTTQNFAETEWRQAREIVVHGKPSGTVDVNYLESRPESDEGPFSGQERDLLNTIAGRLGRVVERHHAEAALRESEEKLRIRTRIANVLLSTSDEGMYAEVLEVILDAMKSEYGIFGHIDENGAWNCPSMTRDIWDRCRMSDKDIVFPRDKWGGIWGRALIDKKTLYSNEPFNVPEGHLPIVRALDVPIVHQGEVIGNFLVGNKGSDYDEKDTKLLEEIADYIAPVLHPRLQRDREEKAREAVASQLRRSQKMEAVSSLAGGIAHDFNNILSAIMGYGQLAQMELDPDSEPYADLKEVLLSVNRARLLIRQILAVGRSQEQERQPMQLKHIVREAIKFLKSTLPSTIEIQEKIDKDVGKIDADPTQMHQILMNLCTNAGHAMEKNGGILQVSLRNADCGLRIAECENVEPNLQPGQYLELTVSDTGHGMTPEVMEKIFDPYFTTKEEGEGTGIGLSVVHGIVAQHGGAITVESEPGKGSKFHVYLPLVQAEEQRPEVKVETPVPTGHERILFIDDEAALARMGKMMLKSLGYHATAMTSSIEALALFRKDPTQFDLVITDTTMPHMPGDILAQELMEIRPDIPVIISTGHSKRISKEKAKEMGIRGFLMKPLDMRVLAETARKALD